MKWALDIDRRWIWLIIFIIVGFVIIRPLGLPIPIGPDAQNFYDTIDALPEGSNVLLGAAYEVGTVGEIQPMVRAFAYHAFKKNLKIFIFEAAWTNGPKLAAKAVEEAAKALGKEYGVDWINLGYKPGGSTTYQLMTSNLLEAVKGVDQNGQALSQFPIMQGITKVDRNTFAAIVATDVGSPGATDYYAFIGEPTGVPVLGMVITMEVPGFKPYVAAGQIKAMLPGSRGAAEYELLVGEPGQAISQQDGQSLAAIYVTLLIILANVAWLTTRNKQ